MTAMMALFIPLFPLLAASVIAVDYLARGNRGEAAEKSTAFISSAAAALSLLLLLLLDISAIFQGTPGQLTLFNWLQSGQLKISIDFMLDPLGLSIATLFALINFLAIRFSIRYLHREAGFQRFFLILNLFNAAMLLITTAGNVVLMFVGWELAGVSSYLLIAYAFDRRNATENASRAFISNRFGDAGFIFAIALLFFAIGNVSWESIQSNSETLSTITADLIALGFLLAALAKSGQIPFSPWIARALEGPTPSSAIFYGSVMVHAGVFLLIRLQPLFIEAPAVMGLLVFFGALTAIYGFISGFVQTDVKSAFLFSTTTQVGLMFIACGLGFFQLAAVYLAAHAVWRAWQFLHAPAYMHLITRSARPAPHWLTRSRKLFVAAQQRFWLDQISDQLVTQPTRALASDLQHFDDKVVTRFVGLPNQASAISSVAQWEAHQQGRHKLSSSVGEASGFAGRFMAWLANLLYWFEEHLVLQNRGGGVLALLRNLARQFEKLEQLLAHPRYLLIMIAATFVAIL